MNKNLEWFLSDCQSDDTIAIALICDWLKSFVPDFNQREAKQKAIKPCIHDIFCALSKSHVIERNFDWFIALFASVVIGGAIISLVLVFQQSFENCSIQWKLCYHYSLDNCQTFLSYPIDSAMNPRNHWVLW